MDEAGTVGDGDAVGATSDASSGVALTLDGAERAVSVRWVSVERLGSWISALVFGGGSIAGAAAWSLAVGGSMTLVALAAAIAFAGVLAFLAAWYPMAAYRRMRYAMNDRGIEIRKGVWWRQVVSVPRQRVQHTDVQQGPLMRRFGIAKLVIHTAGTQHAKVELGGLEHETALAVRDHLIGRGVGRAAGEDGRADG